VVTETLTTLAEQGRAIRVPGKALRPAVAALTTECRLTGETRLPSGIEVRFARL